MSTETREFVIELKKLIERFNVEIGCAEHYNNEEECIGETYYFNVGGKSLLSPKDNNNYSIDLSEL